MLAFAQETAVRNTLGVRCAITNEVKVIQIGLALYHSNVTTPKDGWWRGRTRLTIAEATCLDCIC